MAQRHSVASGPLWPIIAGAFLLACGARTDVGDETVEGASQSSTRDSSSETSSTGRRNVVPEDSASYPTDSSNPVPDVPSNPPAAGGAPSSGPFVMPTGTAGTVVAAGAGGISSVGGQPAMGGTAPAGGQTGSGGMPPEYANCFSYLGEGLRCENSAAHAQSPNLIKLEDAASLSECLDACLNRPDCVAVSDYFAEPDLPLCLIRHGTCGSAGPGVWQEEDAGKEYIKVCPAGGACYFDYLGDWIRCQDDLTEEYIVSGPDLDSCASACLNDPDCTSIVDYYYLSQVPGCYAYTSTCNAPQELPFGDTGETYVKICSLL